MKRSRLYEAAEKAIRQSLRLRRGERFLLVTDTQKLEIAEALAYWAKEVGAETTTYLMTETLRPIRKPTSLFKEMARKATAIAYLLEARMEEKPFRSHMVKLGMSNGRICMMPGLTREMMERLVNIEFTKMNLFTQKVIKAIKDADDVIVSNPYGTRVTFSVKGRKWVNDNGDISRKGQYGNLPAGECFTAPVEQSFSGQVVASLIDNHFERAFMEFEKGRLVRWKGKGLSSIMENLHHERSAHIIGEFGIGTNPEAKMTPNMLEAEKAFGTAHFAIGDSYGLGKNRSSHHYDALVERATVMARGKFILKDGKFLL